MKKYNVLKLVLILSLAFSISGCGKKNVEKAEEVKAPDVQIEQPTQAPAPEKPKEEASTATPSPMAGLEDQIKAFEDKNIYFDFDMFNLTAEAKDILAQKADFLKSHGSMTIQIQGNCDSRGTTEYNLALGERRAKSAADYLVSLGIPAERVSTISYGEERPIDPSDTEEAWAKNRNDHFVIVNR